MALIKRYMLGSNIYYKIMDNFHVRLNVDLGNYNKIVYHSSKEHLKISKIAKFGYQMLKITENI